MSDCASEALPEGFLPREPRIYDAMSKRKNVPLSTHNHRARGRPSRGQGQQYLPNIYTAFHSKFKIANQSILCKFNVDNKPTSKICLRRRGLSLVDLNATMFRSPDATTLNIIPFCLG